MFYNTGAVVIVVVLVLLNDLTTACCVVLYVCDCLQWDFNYFMSYTSILQMFTNISNLNMRLLYMDLFVGLF